jgi:homeobox-leucine zipper protein
MGVDAAASFTSVKDEPAASDGPPPAGVGSSDSDSSGVLNDTDATDATPAAETAPAPDAGTALLGGPGAAVTEHAVHQPEALGRGPAA